MSICTKKHSVQLESHRIWNDPGVNGKEEVSEGDGNKQDG